MDWISGKLYWTDAGWARIEAMDTETLIRVEVLRTGPNTAPRGIALNPMRRYTGLKLLNVYFQAFIYFRCSLQAHVLD